MKFADLIESVAQATDLTKEQSKTVLQAAIAAITRHVVEGEEVTLPNLGKFIPKQVGARKGRNPATGAEIDIPPSRSLRFSPAKAIKEALNPPVAEPAPKGRKKEVA